MFKRLTYRIYPTDTQKALISKHIGACRFVYNLALETKQMAYAGSKKNLTCFDLHNQLPDLKKECMWLNEINSQSLQQAITYLDASYTSFFKGKGSFPKFKKRKSRGGFTVPQKTWIRNSKLSIPKFREGIEINIHRPICGKIKQSTILQTPTNKYFVSFLCYIEDSFPNKQNIAEEGAIGIDLGLKSFIVASDGSEYDNPKFLRKSLSKLKYTQRKYSKYNGKRSRIKFAKVYEKVGLQRKDFLHKVSTKLIRENQTICLEDLNIQGLVPNHVLAFSISDAGWGEFVRQLEYKAEWYGKNIIRIGRFDPSSKTCSCCGTINKDLTLKDREWTCKCGVTHNRDVNAAINIKNFALRNYLSGTDRKNRNELPTLVGVLTSEASI